MKKISVVIPTRNRRRLLGKCLESLAKQSLSKGGYEIIVVDDGSNDKTRETVEKFSKSVKNLKYFHQGNAGPAAARNLGVKQSSAPVVAFIDDDCVAGKNWLSNILDAFRKDVSAWAVEGRTLTRGGIGPFTHCIVNKDGGMFMTCNMAFRKDKLKKAGGFDGRYKKANREDADAAFAAIERGGKIIFAEGALVHHANLKGGLARSLRKKTYYMWDMLLLKKHPGMYRKHIKFPFEKFTPLYILVWVVSLLNYYALAGFAVLALAELVCRRYSFTAADYVKFIVLQSVGSIIIILSIIYGSAKFRSNPLRLVM